MGISAHAWRSANLLPPQPVDDVTDIPVDLIRRTAFEYLRKGFQEGAVSTDATKNTICIDWLSSPVSNRVVEPTFNPTAEFSVDPDAIDENVFTASQQTFIARFGLMPTAACVADGVDLYVCGLLPAGTTVIDRWTLSFPEVMPPVITNPVTGKKNVNIAHPPVETVARVFESSNPALRIVRNITALRRAGQPAADLLVQFDSSLDVYKISISSGGLQLMASATQSGGALGLMSSLAGTKYNSLSYRDHSTFGYLYSLTTAHSHLVGSDIGSLPRPTLIDQNRDGVLDTAVQLTLQQEVQLGWNNLSAYNNWWLR